MRKLAILLNIALMGMIGYLIYDKGMPGKHEIFLFILLISTPIVSFLALLLSKKESEPGLISLYLQRKKLEEAQRISAIKKNL
ncbi:hypothetical protein OEG79_06790 [Pseudomonas sp. Z8(2022)]|uniref:hypothetical protein n=1 Tax=Pseudomonas sp. Z8(2022) TaxID=2962597 RepID=UPI0021F45734|nr:hypothetical protein [Pseudomonas sp. Z8(2022)]UYP31797.1 hypothetical protein OEG79_06790 [Pseudomonas sp. Z8(2022)]